MPEKTTQKEHGKKTALPSEKEVQPEVVIQTPLAELHPLLLFYLPADIQRKRTK